MKWSGRSAIAIAGVCAAATLFSGTAQASPLWEPLQPVANLDAARYVGEWNQVAAIPQPFNLACAKDTRASYGIDRPRPRRHLRHRGGDLQSRQRCRSVSTTGCRNAQRPCGCGPWSVDRQRQNDSGKY